MSAPCRDYLRATASAGWNRRQGSASAPTPASARAQRARRAPNLPRSGGSDRQRFVVGRGAAPFLLAPAPQIAGAARGTRPRERQHGPPKGRPLVNGVETDMVNERLIAICPHLQGSSPPSPILSRSGTETSASFLLPLRE